MNPLPPGPRMSLPLQSLAWGFRPVPFLLRAQQQYGDVFTIRIAAEPPWVMLGHPDAVKEVFTGPPDKLLAGEANQVLRPILGDHSVLLLDGREHLRERRLLLPSFHGERMQRYGELMREIAEDELATWPTGTELALAPRMQAVTMEIILRAVFGVRDAARLDALRRALGELLRFVTDPRTVAVVATLGLDRATRFKAFRSALGPVDRLLYEEIAAHRAAGDLREREDILSLLLQATHEDGAPMTDLELRDELLTLLVAGHETTATALSWAFERLLRTPGAYARLRDEAAGGDGTAYAEAVAHETLRLRPVLPVVLRKLTEDMTIAGHDLPAGTTVAPSIVLVHRRAAVYPDPHAFRPERFLGVKPGTYTWIPFGGGVRRCLGAAFALYELQVVLHAVARHTSLRAAGAANEGVKRRAITLAPGRGAAVVVRDRQPHRPVVAAPVPAVA
ncbi:MAG: cytochrome [Solirubrobacterales bacterium]|nr:cytochrome [Solirubrobacterales bacterium]